MAAGEVARNSDAGGAARPVRLLLVAPDGGHEIVLREGAGPRKVQALAKELAARGKRGWLADLVGDYFNDRDVYLMERAEVGAVVGRFGTASVAFHGKRAKALKR